MGAKRHLTETDRGLGSFRPQSINLFFLPFAGASYYSYGGFRKHVADFVHAVPLDIPGHGKRWREPLLTSLHDMAKDVCGQIKAYADQPFAVYGHSLGATTGYLLCRELEREGMPLPLHLFVSGRQGPPISSKEKGVWQLPEKEFVERIMEYGGTPKEVFESKELTELFIPIIRADVQAIGDYEYEEEEPLDIPISVLIGTEDKCSCEEARAWQAVTKKEIFLRQFQGKHFFIFDHLAEIGDMVSRTLQNVIRKA